MATCFAYKQLQKAHDKLILMVFTFTQDRFDLTGNFAKEAAGQ